MLTNRVGRVLLAVTLFGAVPSVSRADEIVHFTNGAEMTVRTHSVDRDMVKLDLGGNNFISFPMSMVDKIVSAGKDVFLNPTFHPTNQAIAGAPGDPGAASRNAASAVADAGPGMRGGGGAAVGFAPQPGVKGGSGMMLGEVADKPLPRVIGGAHLEHSVANSRRRFDPAHPSPPGSPPQVIMPPSPPRVPVRLAVVRPSEPAEPAPNDGGEQGGSPEGEPPPADPPDTP